MKLRDFGYCPRHWLFGCHWYRISGGPLLVDVWCGPFMAQIQF